jgi:oligopeptide/dipeptide ABC transporter ATP-binding protein
VTALLEVRSLSKRFPLRHGRELHALDSVSLDIQPGRSLGLVGESGSGKTTMGRCIARLLDASEGSIEFEGRDITRLSGRDLRELRARLRIVFQEPFESLNPRLTVGSIIQEPLIVNGLGSNRLDRRRRVAELAERVQLNTNLLGRRPHELSGGQQQRVGIARAIATNPAFIILDEPTSSLDVSVRAQILDLLLELQREQGYSYLFISHDLSTVQYLCTDVAVMYLGRIVERGSTAEVFSNPRHPYTRVLLSSILEPDIDQARRRIMLTGEPTSAIERPVGCGFAPRCPIAMGECAMTSPSLVTVRDSAHEAACIRIGDDQLAQWPALAENERGSRSRAGGNGNR